MRGSGMLYGSRVFIEVSSSCPIPIANRRKVKEATLPDFSLQALFVLLTNLHHIVEHQAGVLVLFLLGECLETILLIEGNGREVGIDSDVTKSRATKLFVQQAFYSVHQPCSDILSTKVQGNCETADLDAWVAAELLALWKVGANLLPSATNNFNFTYLVVENAKISYYLDNC